jgi:hypothetical protein
MDNHTKGRGDKFKISAPQKGLDSSSLAVEEDIEVDVTSNAKPYRFPSMQGFMQAYISKLRDSQPIASETIIQNVQSMIATMV